MVVRSATILAIRRTRFAPNEFGPSFNDERHHLTIAGTSHLPFGLEASPILQFGSARPFLPTSGTNMLNLGGGSDAGALVVTNADPDEPALRHAVDPGDRLVSNVSSIVLAAAKCYYSGNCHLLLTADCVAIRTSTWMHV